jgi:mitogen-activated protein kinase 1/3
MPAPTRSIEELQVEVSALDPRYKLEKILGSGSYGVVARARDTADNNKLVAIKRVNKEIFEETILAKRILREIKLLIHFRDDNIVRIRNLLTPKSANFDSFFIVMDLMDTDVKQVLRSGQKLTDAHIQFFLYQALRGLRVIHTCGVIHRDITPANILVNTNCDLKMCDFGLAKEESEEGEDMTDYVTMRWYRAPELVMEHKAYNGQIDMWGLGLIFGEFLGTKPMCQGKDRVNQLDKIIDVTGTPCEADIASLGSAAAQKYLRKKTQRPPMNLKEKFPNASADALDLLSKMLQFHPDKRISVAAAMKHPYLAPLYDEADEKVNLPPFTFDENKHRSALEVKKAIMEESIQFHRQHPKTAPGQRPTLGAVVGETEGRAAAATLEKPQKDEGRYEDATK